MPELIGKPLVKSEFVTTSFDVTKIDTINLRESF